MRNGKGQFATGNSGKVKGTINKNTKILRRSIGQFLVNNIGNVQEEYDELKPKDKLRFIADILPYVVPKMQTVQAESNTKVSGAITISWEEPTLPDPEN